MGGALGAAGILQGLHWRATGAGGQSPDLAEKLQRLASENQLLKRENEALRSLTQGGGEVAVPPELKDRVETELGLKFLSNPMMHRLVYEELRDRVTASIESRHGPSGIDDRQEAYRAIGWLRADDELLPQLAAVQAVGVRGWFDEVSGDGWVTDRFDLNNIPDQAEMIRLLSRILLHQHFPPPPAYPGDDAARAREALHAGAAEGVESRFYAAHALGTGFVPPKENAEAMQLMRSLSPFMQGLSAFPLAEGKGLADSLHVLGDEPFLAAFRSPPQTTRAIVLPAVPKADSKALDLPEVPETPLLTESAGLLGLRLWLVTAGGDSATIASAWKNDRYVLFPDGESSLALLWDIELATPADTDRLESAALEIVGGMTGGTAARNSILAAAGNRHLLIARPAPTRLRFLNTAEIATATSLQSR